MSEFPAANGSNIENGDYVSPDSVLPSGLQYAIGRWDRGVETVEVWNAAQSLMLVCETISAVSEEDAVRNKKGFEHGGRFISY